MIQRSLKLTRLSKNKYEEVTRFMDKERIFDGRKIVKRKVQDALSLTFFQMLLQNPFQEFPRKLESLALH